MYRTVKICLGICSDIQFNINKQMSENQMKSVIGFMTPKSIIKKSTNKLSQKLAINLKQNFSQLKSQSKQIQKSGIQVSRYEEKKQQTKETNINSHQKKGQLKLELNSQDEKSISLLELSFHNTSINNSNRLNLGSQSHRQVYLNNCKRQSIEYGVKLKASLQNCRNKIYFIQSNIQHVIQKELQTKFIEIKGQLYTLIDKALDQYEKYVCQSYLSNQMQYMSQILQVKDSFQQKIRHVNNSISLMENNKELIWRKAAADLLDFNYESEMKQFEDFFNQKNISQKVKEVVQRAKKIDICKKGYNPMVIESFVIKFYQNLPYLTDYKNEHRHLFTE